MLSGFRPGPESCTATRTPPGPSCSVLIGSSRKAVARSAQRGAFTGIGIMLAFRFAMIQHEPAMTRNTISRPKARARMLFVLSGPLPKIVTGALALGPSWRPSATRRRDAVALRFGRPLSTQRRDYRLGGRENINAPSSACAQADRIIYGEFRDEDRSC